jgi:hypothetical protein
MAAANSVGYVKKPTTVQAVPVYEARLPFGRRAAFRMELDSFSMAFPLN